MNDYLKENPANYMVPFLWMHGEDEPRLREVIGAIHQSGIGALCVESRPQPDFLGPKWWQDMDVVLDECKKRGMKIWILDDERFPTGYSAGRAAGSPHCIRYLNERHVDIAGPQKGSSILLNLPVFNRRQRNTDPIISDPIFEFYHSFTFNDGANTVCPHVGYRINVHVTDTLKRAVEGAEIAVTPRESRFDSVSSGKKTDASGTAVVYAQRANPTKDTKNDSQLDVTVTASYTDPADPEKKPITISATATEKGLSADHKLQPQDVYLEMDLRKFYLSFEDIGSGHAQDMPDPLLFFPGRTVHIPDTVPSKSGLQFTGWNTRADGTGSAYAPGTSLTPKGDLTLYAQWTSNSSSSKSRTLPKTGDPVSRTAIFALAFVGAALVTMGHKMRKRI